MSLNLIETSAGRFATRDHNFPDIFPFLAKQHVQPPVHDDGKQQAPAA